MMFMIRVGVGSRFRVFWNNIVDVFVILGVILGVFDLLSGM